VDFSLMTRRRRDFPGPPPDPAPDYTEWIEHRYDPGYYTGGRIPPYLKRKPGGPGSPIGWVFIVGAAIALVIVVAEIRQNRGIESILNTIFVAAVVLLQLLAGIKLLGGDRGPKRPST